MDSSSEKNTFNMNLELCISISFLLMILFFFFNVTRISLLHHSPPVVNQVDLVVEGDSIFGLGDIGLAPTVLCLSLIAWSFLLSFLGPQ